MISPFGRYSIGNVQIDLVKNSAAGIPLAEGEVMKAVRDTRDRYNHMGERALRKVEGVEESNTRYDYRGRRFSRDGFGGFDVFG